MYLLIEKVWSPSVIFLIQFAPIFKRLDFSMVTNLFNYDRCGDIWWGGSSGVHLKNLPWVLKNDLRPKKKKKSLPPIFFFFFLGGGSPGEHPKISEKTSFEIDAIL